MDTVYSVLHIFLLNNAMAHSLMTESFGSMEKTIENHDDDKSSAITLNKNPQTAYHLRQTYQV